MNLEMFKNKGFEIRGGAIKDESYFVLSDVAKALGIKNITDLKNRLNPKGLGQIELLTNGGTQKQYIISEANLYRAIFRSDKEEARLFEDWIVEEVLPSIRKHGGYIENDLKNHIEQFLPKEGYLQENKNGELKTKAIRGYYRVDKNSEYGKLLTRRHQLQKRMNGLFIEEIKLELSEIESDILELEEKVA